MIANTTIHILIIVVPVLPMNAAGILDLNDQALS